MQLDLSSPRVKQNFASHIEEYKKPQRYSINVFTLLAGLLFIALYQIKFKFRPRKIKKVLYKIKRLRWLFLLLLLLLLPKSIYTSSVSEKAEAKVVTEKVESVTPIPTVYHNVTPTPVPVSEPIDYKAFIYFHESGNNPQKYNGSGCVGLGQACPGSKLLAVCPNLDYACEDQFFTDYMVRRYGSWENAYNIGMSRGTAGVNGGWGWW